MTTWFLPAVTAVLSLLLLWGLVAPRSQWRVLVGWSTADPDAAEPGDGVHGIRRTVCAIGLVGVLAVAGVQGWRLLDRHPSTTTKPSAIQLMWGSPTPQLLDRLVGTVEAAPEGLVAGGIEGVQLLAKGPSPAYLVSLPRFVLLGDAAPLGLVGRPPAQGTTGYGQADLVLEASGPLDCIPRSVVAVATNSAVRLGVYWGPPGDLAAGTAAACDMTAPVLQRVLIPVQLPDAIGDRRITTEAGDAIPVVKLQAG